MNFVMGLAGKLINMCTLKNLNPAQSLASAVNEIDTESAYENSEDGPQVRPRQTGSQVASLMPRIIIAARIIAARTSTLPWR